MLKAFQYRIYPTPEQELLLTKHFDAVRCIFNIALELKSYLYSAYGINISMYDMKKEIPLLKDENVWLKDVNSQAIQESLFNLDDAYKRFFKGQGGFPRFKKKNRKQSFTCPQNFSVKDGKINLPKFKESINDAGWGMYLNMVKYKLWNVLKKLKLCFLWRIVCFRIKMVALNIPFTVKIINR